MSTFNDTAVLANGADMTDVPDDVLTMAEPIIA
jgi:hypothetical protein